MRSQKNVALTFTSSRVISMVFVPPKWAAFQVASAAASSDTLVQMNWLGSRLSVTFVSQEKTTADSVARILLFLKMFPKTLLLPEHLQGLSK